MAKFVVYAHNNENPESDMIYLCSCDEMEKAKFIVDALKFQDSQKKDITVPYVYYINEIK